MINHAMAYEERVFKVAKSLLEVLKYRKELLKCDLSQDMSSGLHKILKLSERLRIGVWRCFKTT